MENLIGLNPGLKSRFKTFIDFKDYSPTDLLQDSRAYGGGGRE